MNDLILCEYLSQKALEYSKTEIKLLKVKQIALIKSLETKNINIYNSKVE